MEFQLSEFDIEIHTFVKLKSQLRNYLSHKSIETLEKMMDSVNAYNDKDDLSSTSEIIRRFTLEGLNHRHLPAKISPHNRNLTISTQYYERPDQTKKWLRII